MFGLKIVHQNHVGLVEFLGKYHHSVGAGMHFYIPLFQKIYPVSLAMNPLRLPNYSIITKDNADIKASLTLNYHVTDAKKYRYENTDSVESMSQLVRGHLRDIIGRMDLNEALGSTSKINANLAEAIGDLTSIYGINVDRVNIDELTPSPSIQQAMDQQLKADREKTAAIAKANGEAKSIEVETKAKNDARISIAKAEAQATITRADAEAYRINKLNDMLATVDDKYFTDQRISAFKTLADSPANTVVMSDSNLSDLKNVPAMAQVLKSTEGK